MLAQSSTLDRSAPPSNDTPAAKRLKNGLPPVLSAVAGMVDVISFVSLKLFTAHVTGNLVVIAALLVRGGPPNLAQILAVPVFVLAVAGVWLIAKRLNKRGPALARPLLLVQFLLLACVLIVAVVYHPAADPHGVTAGIAAMIAVSAMACQFALLRLAVPGAPSTAVMTGNLTKTTLSLLDTFSGSVPVVEDARMQLKKTVQLVAGFFAGCLLGAGAFSWLGEWAWLLPVVLAGVAVALP
jgi:uncharacterized membrane protein YoaK (UPF0700 family)